MTDASFTNSTGLKSQLVYVLMMADKDNHCNIVHYGSNKGQRMAMSVMAAEVQAVILGFDYAFLIKTMIKEILGRTLVIEAIIDKKTVFNIIAKEGKTTEKRLQIDVLSIRESYDLGELRRTPWIPGVANLADSITKPVLSTESPLFRIIITNKLTLEPDGWATSLEMKMAGVSMCTN